MVNLVFCCWPSQVPAVEEIRYNWIFRCKPGLDNSRLGMIGFDGDLFVAGKRAENVESTRDDLHETTSAKSNRTEFALAA